MEKESSADVVRELILTLRAPKLTPESIALHERIASAKRDRTLSDTLLNECVDPECIVCGKICCPHSEPLHFHHDGCPACAMLEKQV
jgi:hypothetical protein